MGQQLSACVKSDICDRSAYKLHPEDWMKPLMEQDYHRIKDHCLKTGKLFQDPIFPASSSSLYYHFTPRHSRQWMRPNEIAGLLGSKPEFFIRGSQSNDLIQGELGNCWVIAAAASLADHPHLLNRVVPPDQSFSTEYAGIFRFNFYMYGRWIPVVVDDQLPTDHGRLVYVHSSQPNEFWAALLEKAYAKLFGCYQALQGGACADALTSFTGATVETFPLKSEAPSNIERILVHAVDTASLICAGIGGGKIETLQNGLVTAHAFSVIDVQQVELLDDRGGWVTLLKIRNPWGNRIEWKGRWSDLSRTWNYVSDKSRRKLKYKISDDGEFWMDLQDFVNNFDQVDICHMKENSRNNKQWRSSVLHGIWIKRKTAGGRLKFYDTFSNNPQFELQVGDDNYHSKRHDQITIIIELTQKRPRSRIQFNALYIGFVLYQLQSDQMLPLSALFFQDHRRVGIVDAYVNSWCATKRFNLAPGRYLIVPSTWEPDEQGSFMLRVWSQAPVKLIQ